MSEEKNCAFISFSNLLMYKRTTAEPTESELEENKQDAAKKMFNKRLKKAKEIWKTLITALIKPNKQKILHVQWEWHSVLKQMKHQKKFALIFNAAKTHIVHVFFLFYMYADSKQNPLIPGRQFFFILLFSFSISISSCPKCFHQALNTLSEFHIGPENNIDRKLWKWKF